MILYSSKDYALTIIALIFTISAIIYGVSL